MSKVLFILALFLSVICFWSFTTFQLTLAYRLPFYVAAIISGIAWFWAFGAIIAACLEELARFFAEKWHLWSLGERLMLASYALLKLPVIGRGLQQAECATELARLLILQGKNADARQWAEKAALHILAQSKPAFPTLSREGWVYFHLGELEKSEKYLSQAKNKFASEHAKVEPFAGEESRWQALNLDLLARIELQNGRVDRAKEFFTRSAKLRTETKSLKHSAEAYEQNILGTLLLGSADGSPAAAESHILAAAQLLPANLRHELHRQVALDVLANLGRLDSAAAKTVSQSLSSRCGDSQLRVSG